MQINATNNLTPLPERRRQVTEPPTITRAATTFTEIDALERKITATTDVRAEAVAHAKALIAQPEYPPERVIRSISRLLAMNLESDDK
jgi:hypothetical protein